MTNNSYKEFTNMYYRKWNEQSIEGLISVAGITIIYTEIDIHGNVCREIGFNAAGELIHKFPSNLYQYGLHGIFDGQKVTISDQKVMISKNEFEKLWYRTQS